MMMRAYTFFLLLGWLTLPQFSVAQQGTGSGTTIVMTATSNFVPTIKDAIKFSDRPEIRDSVKRLTNFQYPITSRPVFPPYEVSPITAAKLKNEPQAKLYRSILKLGYSPFYSMPLGDFRVSSLRSRNSLWAASARHLSSNTHLAYVGYGGFSENELKLSGKQFYAKHTLSGDLNYERNVVHYYGYDTSINKLNEAFTRQRYQLIEPKVRLMSHYTDSTHINHDLTLGFHNLRNLHGESENNIKFNGIGSFFVNKEKLNVNFLTDFYNNRQRTDTLNNLIMTLNPSFEANGGKWHVDIGIAATFDRFKETNSFYFYPQLNMHYDVYNNLVVPYGGITGGLIKNSMRSLVQENPFVDTTMHLCNTDNKYNFFAGLRGHLSSKASYDVKATYSRLDSLYFFVTDYRGPQMVYNQFNVIYDDAMVLNLNGQLKYQIKEKLNISAKANYYYYKTKTLVRAYGRPEFDMTFSAVYNLQSKIIVKGDLYVMGKQWGMARKTDGVNVLYNPQLISEWFDVNLEGEYRYSKMMSFFLRFNNIAGQRYYRWYNYPSQRFSFMIGVTFIPF